MSDESDGSDGRDEFTWGVSEPDDAEATTTEPSDADDERSDAGDEGFGNTDERYDDPEAETGPDEEFEPSLAGVVGANREEEPVQRDLVPESPSLENAVFLLVGVLLGLFVIYQAATTFGV